MEMQSRKTAELENARPEVRIEQVNRKRHRERCYDVKRNLTTEQWGTGFIANMNKHIHSQSQLGDYQ